MADAAGRNKLIGCVGVACAAILLAAVPRFEGTELVAYKDPIGIVTSCVGHTGPDVKLGRTYTPAECQALLAADLVKHAEPVLKCTPRLKDHPKKLAAAVSFAFNVGTTAYCGSTLARKLNAGDPTACAEFSRWVKADGRVLPGLVKRRAEERALCESGE